MRSPALPVLLWRTTARENVPADGSDQSRATSYDAHWKSANSGVEQAVHFRAGAGEAAVSAATLAMPIEPVRTIVAATREMRRRVPMSAR